MSLAKAILGTLAGIPRAVHLSDEMRDRDLSEIMHTLVAVHGELQAIQERRRKLGWERSGYARRPHWGEVYTMGGDGEPEDAAC